MVSVTRFPPSWASMENCWTDLWDIALYPNIKWPLIGMAYYSTHRVPWTLPASLQISLLIYSLRSVTSRAEIEMLYVPSSATSWGFTWAWCQGSADLWRPSWQWWLFTGSTVWEEALKHRQKDQEGQIVVRAQVWTVVCMSVDVTSGLQDLQSQVSPDPGGWHWDVRSGDVMGGERLVVGLPEVEQRDTVSS